jgi:hypothetical protein
MPYRRRTEVRWLGSRIRFFTVVWSDDADTTRSIRMATADVDYEVRGQKGVDAFVSAFSMNQLVTVITAEQWQHGVPKEQARLKLAAWRKRCETAGLTKSGTFEG